MKKKTLLLRASSFAFSLAVILGFAMTGLAKPKISKKPFGKTAMQYEFTIWDRWGEKIFTGSDTMPWDGSVNGSSFPAHDGVYIYQVQILNSSVASDLITGRVSLVR